MNSNDSTIPPHNQSNNDDSGDAAVTIDKLIQLQELKITTEQAKQGKRAVNTADPSQIPLEVAVMTDETVQLHYLLDPWLPREQVLVFYGRRATAKSSFDATMATVMS